MAETLTNFDNHRLLLRPGAAILGYCIKIFNGINFWKLQSIF